LKCRERVRRGAVLCEGARVCGEEIVAAPVDICRHVFFYSTTLTCDDAEPRQIRIGEVPIALDPPLSISEGECDPRRYVFFGFVPRFEEALVERSI
jgi:hypothetical protein